MVHFTKDELREKVYSLKKGENPHVDFTKTYVEELLDEMFPNHKSVKMNAGIADLGKQLNRQPSTDKVNEDLRNARFDHFVLVEYD